MMNQQIFEMISVIENLFLFFSDLYVQMKIKFKVHIG